MKRATEFMEAATNLLDDAGINYVVEYGRHLKIRWTFEGHSRLYVMSVSQRHSQFPSTHAQAADGVLQ
jgi:hypothetical protein